MSEATSPTAAVLIIGDEILSGRTKDTNLNTLARFLTALGIDLKEARTVGDTRSQIIDAVRTLSGGHDYLFTTGGIGPTHDDITADCVAEAMGVALPENDEAMAILERRYGDELNDARRRMARIPEGGSLIANPVTDAPGFQIGNVFVMAGVPKIMTAMLDDVAPRLRVGAITHARTLKVEGVGEGDVAELLTAAADANRTLSFGSYPFGHGTVGEYGTQLVVRGRDAAVLSAAVEALKEAVEVTLADRGVRVFEVQPEA
ncbi:MAG: molybdopterin-binding protein [Brevundimonas sp.]|uniref:competence/damage-inducible protein A n=1 Tax=Brevundimonas sp. TaxID=1871086 RepID=UPI002778CD27|nr:molybdopterin-binding protein [Brevundimonas sp.]MDP3399615.1 molybdopterin-binding protein [Brevundimonas sp.]MDZ4109515.1 molybdopterin-binding protein [Brevundimonas sp.]